MNGTVYVGFEGSRNNKNMSITDALTCRVIVVSIAVVSLLARRVVVLLQAKAQPTSMHISNNKVGCATACGCFATVSYACILRNYDTTFELRLATMRNNDTTGCCNFI